MFCGVLCVMCIHSEPTPEQPPSKQGTLKDELVKQWDYVHLTCKHKATSAFPEEVLHPYLHHYKLVVNQVGK